MKKIFFGLLFALTIASFAYAAESSKIELADGSTVDGEIISFSDGKYTVRSPSLGTLQVEDANVRTIRKGNEPGGTSPQDVTSLDKTTLHNEMQKLRPAITGNPDIMKTIAGLMSDPAFQALFKDPEIMNAAKNLDVKALMANPQFVSAVNHPAIQEIRQKLKGQSGQTS